MKYQNHTLFGVEANIFAAIMLVLPTIAAYINNTLGTILQLIVIILIFVVKDSPFVKFYAIQYGLLQAVGFVLGLIIGLLSVGAVASSSISTLATTVLALSAVLVIFGLFVLGCVVFMAYNAFNYNVKGLPFIGKLALKWSGINNAQQTSYESYTSSSIKDPADLG